MNSKKILLALCMTAITLTAARADEMNAGKIHFSGTIVDTTCKIVGDSGSDINVNVGSFPPSAFPTVGSKSDDVPFSITLTDCPIIVDADSLDHVQLTFTGATVSGKKDILELDDASTATGVGFSISVDGSTDNIDLTGAEGQVMIPLNATGNSIQQNFMARFQSIAAKEDITPGSGSAQLAVNIIYK